jgi:hypothetical protein
MDSVCLRFHCFIRAWCPTPAVATATSCCCSAFPTVFFLLLLQTLHCAVRPTAQQLLHNSPTAPCLPTISYCCPLLLLLLNLKRCSAPHHAAAAGAPLVHAQPAPLPLAEPPHALSVSVGCCYQFQYLQCALLCSSCWSVHRPSLCALLKRAVLLPVCCRCCCCICCSAPHRAAAAGAPLVQPGRRGGPGLAAA